MAGVAERTRTETALRDREQQLASIYNAVRDVIFYLAVEPEGRFRFVSVNERFLRVTGLGPDAVVGKTVNEVIPEPSLTMVLEKYREAIEHKTTVSWEQISEYPTGRLTGEVTVAPVFDNQGACTHLVGLVHDITERKHAESALCEGEERFRTVADSAPVMIWMAGLDKLCNFFNQPWLEFTGRTMEQELGNGWANGVHPEDLDRCLATYVSSFDARRSFRMEYRLRRADGVYRWVLDNGTPLYREGNFAGYIGSCIDVTEQKRVEEELRSNQAQLIDSQRLAKVGSWELDVATRRTRWSDEWYRIFGLPRDVQPEFETFLSCVHPNDRQVVLEGENQSYSADKPFDEEFRIIRPDGEVRFIRSIFEAVKNEEGVVIRLAGANQDVTDARRAQEESFARQKLESLGTLASGIAHDFNNLLGAVLAQTELAMAELGPGSPDVNEQLNSIRDVAIRGSEIVRQLMIYAEKESDVLQPLDVSTAVQEMLALLKVAVSRQAALVIDLGEALTVVRARGAQISQIVMNLVVNASDALGDRDGVIRVSTRRVALGQAEAMAKALPAGCYVQLEVSDTGCGMSPETQAKIFDPFFTTKFSGRGLGLAVVYGIVRSLHGAIEVASEAGKGTTFQVLLPCIEPGSHPDDARLLRRDVFASPARRATILLVEDEGTLRLAIAKMLRKWGLEAIEAASGSAAIDLLRANREIDLMLLDLTIPGASSEEVLAEAAVAQPKVKVVLTSAYSEEVAEGIRGGPLVCGFIRKPFKIADLAQRLQSVLLS
jgi:PAS domain S-box-containing protein